ncbi:MAG: antibiotic biosynthesis monooxygenase [bacterium]
MINPWKMRSRPEPDREYLGLVSTLPLRRFRDIGRFLHSSARIQEQLRTTPGLIGYSLMASVWSKTFRTLSVWEDEAALQRFVGTSPHVGVMSALQGKMGRTTFVRWRIRGSECPPRWEDALRRESAAATTRPDAPGGRPSAS